MRLRKRLLTNHARAKYDDTSGCAPVEPQRLGLVVAPLPPVLDHGRATLEGIVANRFHRRAPAAAARHEPKDFTPAHGSRLLLEVGQRYRADLAGEG
jgi:hypothetical protein